MPPEKKERPPKKKGYKVGKVDTIYLRISKEEFPNVAEMLSAKNPQELREKWGIALAEDLGWSTNHLKGFSQRAGAILETLARKKNDAPSIIKRSGHETTDHL